jgi:hypothetical protein
MTANTTTATRRVTAGAVPQHDCADRGLPGLALSDATAIDAEKGSSSSA